MPSPAAFRPSLTSSLLLFLTASCVCPCLVSADGAAAPAALPAPSPIRSWNLAPIRLLWKSDKGVSHAENLLGPKPGQAVLKESRPPCELAAGGSILLDFGREIQGSVELFAPLLPDKKPRSVRVRFGESAAETMVELGEREAQNDHALRDRTVTLPWLGKTTLGPSGFRFVRIDAAPGSPTVQLSEVRAVLQMRDLARVGSFKCDDERLNRIWETGVYTVQLNMQDYLWDGVKRDRLVWIGDMHPEVSTINAAFGSSEVVTRSLDLTREVTPVTEWMNGISSYSMWWIQIHESLWMHHGDKAYLVQQQPYMTALLKRLATFVGPDGSEKLDGMRFLDWPTFENKVAVHEGLQAMMTTTMESGARLMTTLGDADTAKLCADTAAKLRRHQPAASGRKSPAALLALAGFRPPAEVAKVLAANGPSDVSTFYGFYIIEALAQAGQTDTALDFISQYWGGMLDFGATTFWEDFNLDWTKNAGRIDELVPAGKKDLHGDFGAFCYLGFRHSLCHGWASGPTPWLSRHVLGIEPLEPGCAKVRVKPALGRLKFAEGSYPTPKGPITVRHEKRPDGTVKSVIIAPPGIEIVRE